MGASPAAGGPDPIQDLRRARTHRQTDAVGRERDLVRAAIRSRISHSRLMIERVTAARAATPLATVPAWRLRCSVHVCCSRSSSPRPGLPSCSTGEGHGKLRGLRRTGLRPGLWSNPAACGGAGHGGGPRTAALCPMGRACRPGAAAGVHRGITNALLRGEAPDCHCFGQLQSEPAGRGTLARNVVLAAMAAFVTVEGPGPSVTAWVGDRSAAELVAVAAGIAAVVLGALLLRLWQSNRDLRRHLDNAHAELAAFPPGLPVGAPAPGFSLPNIDGETVTRRASGRAADPWCWSSSLPDAGHARHGPPSFSAGRRCSRMRSRSR